jgi:hypothetical protein
MRRQAKDGDFSQARDAAEVFRSLEGARFEQSLGEGRSDTGE